MADSAKRSELAGKVLQGTCGWSDASIVKCGRFYPASAKSTEDRLLHYSRVFPCVECDSSNYAIPSPAAVERWLKCVPGGFKFHFKAFGLFTRKAVNVNALPRIVRDELPPIYTSGQTTIDWYDLSDQLRQKLWDRYNSALLPAHEKKKLGVVIFQFHLGFQPSDVNKDHILECRRNLDTHYQMAVEFRCRNWLNEQNLLATSTWLQEANIGLVIADELQNELYFDKNRSTINTPKEVVPIVTALGSRQFMYIRVHRRTGKERILSSVEIKSWGKRLRTPDIQRNIQGPIYFMWGTDHEDQPIINSKNLTAEIGNLAFDWKGKISQTGLLRFCSVKQENSQRQLENTEGTKESICSSKSLVGTDMVCGGLTEGSCEIAKDESSLTNEKELSISFKGGPSPVFSADGCRASFSSDVETRKRSLTPSGTKSPKKQRKGAQKKSSLTPPVNQRKISAFFKK